MISREGISLVGMVRDGLEAVQMAVQYRPNAVILTEDLPVIDGYQAASLISAAAPDVKCFLIVESESPDTLRKAMRMGVRECLGRPCSPRTALDTAAEVLELDRLRDRPEYQTALDPERFPRIIVVTGAKGGIGK